ncbi:MAG: hypothetical protein AAGI25_19690 [Bacteroidota bacterium]
MKLKAEAVVGIVGTALFIGLLAFIFESWSKEEQDIQENGQKTIGRITRTYRIKSRGDYIVFKFNYDGKKYEEHQSVEGSFEIGDCYSIVFSTKNPQHANLITSEKRNCK